MKKTISVLICIIMLIGILPLNAFAAEVITSVSIGDISSPVVGNNPDYIATYGQGYNYCTNFDDDSKTVYGISWRDKTEDKLLSDTDVFVAGHEYSVSVVAKTISGYSFRKEDNFTSDVLGYVNGNSASDSAISGYNAGEYVVITYSFPACDFERVDSININVNIPAPGEVLDFNPTVSDDRFKINEGSVTWKNITTDTYASKGDKAVAGNQYILDLWVNPKDPSTTRLAVDADEINDITAKISGYEAEVVEAAANGATAGLSITFTVPDFIDSVAVSGIDAPAYGKTPDTQPNATIASYKISALTWIDVTSDSYYDWKYDITEFKVGHKYRVKITLETNGANRFKNVNGEVTATAMINGNPAGVHYSDDPTEFAIYYDFGVLPNVIVDKVSVSDIDIPVAGATPDTTATCGTGYAISKITWVDTTGEYKDWVYDVTEFEAGHKYTVQVELKTSDGYEFIVIDGYNEVTGTINGNSALVYGSHSATEVSIGYDFGTLENTVVVIDKVYVNGIDAPVAGATPDMEATCGEGYTISKIVWVDSTGEYKDWVYGVEKFEAGHNYTVQVTLVTNDGYKYVMDDGYNDVVGEINMETATVYGSHSDTEVTIGYNFGEVTDVHTHNYSPVITAPTCTEKGYTTYTCACGDTYTDNETAATGHTPEVIPGKAATTTETGLTDGEKCSVCNEILKEQTEIPKISEEHKHTPGEWVVVKNAEVGVEGKEQKKCTDCGQVLEERVIPALENPDKDFLIGDVNNDGKITAADARLALRISAGLDTLETVKATLEMVDYNGDKKITAADARLILRKSAGLE